MFCGIDPGVSGSLAFVDSSGSLRGIHPVPLMARGKSGAQVVNVKAVGELHALYGTIATALEDVGGRSGEGASSNNKFTKAIGALYGVSEYLNTVAWVAPQVWKKHFALIGKDKEASRAKAIELFPEDADFFTPKRKLRTKKQAQDNAEAALIARWYYDTRGRLIEQLIVEAKAELLAEHS